MKAIYLTLVFALLMVGVAAAANTGAIWTTTGSCGDPQDANHYKIGDHIFINGDGFAADNYSWDISGLPGGASCDPSTMVASGNAVVDESGAFCFDAYTVMSDDCGEYKASVGNKHDNYRVDVPDVQVPEFGVIAATLAAVGAIGVVLYKRKN
jgi:hypothetical protein